MEDGKRNVGMDPDMDDDSDDEVSLLVVDEDELNTTLNEAGIQVKVSCWCMTDTGRVCINWNLHLSQPSRLWGVYVSPSLPLALPRCVQVRLRVVYVRGGALFFFWNKLLSRLFENVPTTLLNLSCFLPQPSDRWMRKEAL